MATTFSAHSLHLQHHHLQQSSALHSPIQIPHPISHLAFTSNSLLHHHQNNTNPILHHTQNIHQQQQQQQQNSTSSQNQQNTEQPPQQQTPTSDHFCKDCGVMFESSTSLEVHLSYHKENLLSRWATQDSGHNLSSSASSVSSVLSSLSSSSSSSSSSTSGIHSNSSNISVSSNASSTMEKSLTHTPSPQPSSDSSSISSSGPQPHHTQYFLDFVPVPYGSSNTTNTNTTATPNSNNNNNNNTSDHHHMEPSPNRGGAGGGPFQPPVDHHHGHLYGNIPHHSHPNHQYPSHPNHLYSPNHDQNGPNSNTNNNSNNNDPTLGDRERENRSSGGGGGGVGEHNPPKDSREPAEILDLDSHKVHVYQQQQQQQQQQERSFFHRPYLPLPPHPNGWHDQFNPIGFPPPLSTNLTDSPYGGIPPVPSQPLPPSNQSANPYDLIRSEPNPIYSNDPPHHSLPPMGTYPSHLHPVVVPSNNPSQTQYNNSNNNSSSGIDGSNGHGGRFNIGSNGLPNSITSVGVVDRRSPINSSRSPTIPSGNNNNSTPGGGTMSKSSSSIAPTSAPKTKGWKGGECKRPKTYNCQACNKWFTSSGHLKRHYGTTLHKNSVRQKGEGFEDPPPATMKRKNGPGPGDRANDKTNGGDRPTGGGDHVMKMDMDTSTAAGGVGGGISESSSPSPRSVIKLEDTGKSTVGGPTTTTMYGSSLLTTTMSSSRDNTNTGSASYTSNGGVGPNIHGLSPNKHNTTSNNNSTTTSSINSLSSGPIPSNSPYLQQQQQQTVPPGSYHPPSISPYGSNNNNNSDNRANNIINGPTSQQQQQQTHSQQQQQQQQPYLPPNHNLNFHPTGVQLHHPPVPFSNGYAPETISTNSIYGSVPSPIVPTTIYSGYSVINMNGETTPLPPFSTVGFSHYDPNSYHHHHPHHLQQQQLGPPLPPHQLGPSPYPPASLPSPSPNRMSSQQQQQPYNIPPPSSPSSINTNSSSNNNNNIPSTNGNMTNTNKNNINTSNHLDNSFDSETNHNRGDSPEEIRSASTTASVDGSLDGMDVIGSGCSDGGSPTRCDRDSSGESNKDGGDSEGEVLKCPDCSKTFGRACYLTQHTNSSHSGTKKFKCPTCGKRFPEAPALSDHLTKHGSDKPYKCNLCPKQFNHKTDLRRHLCLHTGEKPYVCPYEACNKGFIRKDHMVKHAEIHRKKLNNNNSSSNNNNNNNS